MKGKSKRNGAAAKRRKPLGFATPSVAPRLALLRQRVSASVKEVGQLRVVRVGAEGFGGDGGADVDVGGTAALVEGFGGDAQGTDLPTDAAEEVEEGGVAEVKADGIDGHAGFADEADDAVCPRPIEDLAAAVAKRHSAGGEEAEVVA